VPRMAVRRLVPRTSLAEIHLAGNAGTDHPLERPVDRRAADAGRFAVDDVHEIVGAEMTFLAQKDLENPIAFA